MTLTAEFLGWQLGRNGEKLFPLFNLRGNHPKNGSTVGLQTLRDLGVSVPEYK